MCARFIILSSSLCQAGPRHCKRAVTEKIAKTKSYQTQTCALRRVLGNLSSFTVTATCCLKNSLIWRWRKKNNSDSPDVGCPLDLVCCCPRTTMPMLWPRLRSYWVNLILDLGYTSTNPTRASTVSSFVSHASWRSFAALIEPTKTSCVKCTRGAGTSAASGIFPASLSRRRPGQLPFLGVR